MDESGRLQLNRLLVERAGEPQLSYVIRFNSSRSVDVKFKFPKRSDVRRPSRVRNDLLAIGTIFFIKRWQ